MDFVRLSRSTTNLNYQGVEHMTKDDEWRCKQVMIKWQQWHNDNKMMTTTKWWPTQRHTHDNQMKEEGKDNEDKGNTWKCETSGFDESRTPRTMLLSFLGS